MRRGSRVALGAGLAFAFALAPITPLVPISAGSPFMQLAAVSPAAALEGCAPGAMARIPGPPPVLDALDATPGSLSYTGKGILVAIVDSGVDSTHPQLAPALVSGSTSLVSDGERPDGLGDPLGQGTAVAGIIAARPLAGSGVTGVAPDANIVSIRAFASDEAQSESDGNGPDAERLADGINRAVDLDANIIVVAVSDDVDSASLREASANAADSGALIVASAGNRDTTASVADGPRYPAAYPGALAVTAVSLSGRPTDDSIHGDHVDVAAPGQEVLTTATGAGDCIYAADAPSSSFSTAYVAGFAALLAEAYPDEGPTGWIYRLEATADRPNPDARDDMIGWGRIRPQAALELRPDSSTRGPESPFADTSNAAAFRPHTSITRTQTGTLDMTLGVVVATILGGLIVVIALVAQLRRQRLLRTKVEAEDAATAAREREAENFKDPDSAESQAARDANDYPGLSRR
ncbi:MAG: S8 family serine peptidase [Leucobacter sp.]